MKFSEKVKSLKSEIKEKIHRTIRKIKKLHYMHYLAFLITLGFVCLAAFKFRNGFYRMGETFRDLGTSIAYYFIELFELDLRVMPTVNEYSIVPAVPIFNLPATWEEFKTLWGEYWVRWASKENFLAFGEAFGNGAETFARIMLLAVVPLVLILWLLFQRYLNKHNNDYNVDSKPLKVCRRIADFTYKPAIRWLRCFIEFLREHDKYLKFWLFVWCYNFNVIVIGLEFFAFYFYLVVSFDFISIYRQVVKLFRDISVPVAFLPGITWVFVGLWIFNYIRKKIAYQTLYHHEAMNCGFINERSMANLIVGTTGKNKTLTSTDMILLQEKMYFEKALDLMIKNDMKFPNFPWINLENYIKKAIETHRVYNLATIRKTIRHLRFCFEEYHNGDAKTKQHIRRHLKRRYKLEYENLIFDYDFERYGLWYDDKLKVTNIWKVIENYAQEYSIFIKRTSLIISNYSVRSDNILLDLGNLPMRDSDFYHRNSKMLDEISKYAHVTDYNAMRLGRKIGDNDPKKDALEYGVIGNSEFGKERKNNLQLQEIKRKDEGTNQKNDGYNDWNKMKRHAATIEYFSFIKEFADEQRAESLGADVRDIYDVIHIKDGGKTKLALPFFFIEELINSFFYEKFEELYKKYRFIRADNTLVMYLLKKLASKFECYYQNTYNLFGYKKQILGVENGTLDGDISEKVYYLDFKRIYADRYSTDCYAGFFESKALRSKLGIDDFETYRTTRATMDELKMQNSYFVADLINKQENDK